MRNFLFSAWENLIYILVGILAMNVIVLDVFTFVAKPKPIVQNINLSGQTQSSSATSGAQTIQSTPNSSAISLANACPNTCLAAIQTATASLKLTQNVVNNSTTQTVQGTANEYFIPFGSATAANQGSYATVTGLQAYVNMSQYTGVQTVVFEVTMGGNGIVQAQLYDATDSIAIPNSQVSMSGGNPQLVISSPLTLPSGNKLYQVQIQTQLNQPATINQARLHITTQ